MSSATFPPEPRPYTTKLQGFFVLCSGQGITSGACVPSWTSVGGPEALPFATTVNGQALTSTDAIESAADAGLVALINLGPDRRDRRHDQRPLRSTTPVRRTRMTPRKDPDMTSNARTAATSRMPHDRMRKTALVAGVLYLLTFISSIPAVFLQGPVLTDPNFIIGGAGADTQVRLGALFDIVNSLTAIGTAVALYAVIKRQSQSFAIGFVSSRLFEGTVLMIGVISILSIVTLQQPGATGAEAPAPCQHAADARHRPQLDLRARDRRPCPQRVPAWLDHVQVAPRPSRDPGDRTHRRSAVHLLDHRLRPRRHRAGTAWHAIGVAPIFIWELSLACG